VQALVDTSPVSPDLRNGWAWNIEECVFIMGFATWKNAKSSHFVWVFSLFAQTAPCFSAIFSQTRAGQVGPRFEANEMLYNPRAVPWLKLPLSHGHHGRIQRSEAMKSQELHRHHQMFFLGSYMGIWWDIWIIYGWHSRSREKVLLTSDLRRMQSFSSKPVASSWGSAAMEEVKLICSKMSLDLH
jgi:hypothetical protein